MSRKTRKLMWSVPLIAAVAVIGVLAAYVMLAPGEAQAHSAVDSSIHLPPDPVTGIDVTTPSAADGGRTSLRVTWNVPTGGDPVETYRIDMSKHTRIWHNVIGGERSSDVLTESMAMSSCDAEDDAGNRCYTVDELDSDTTYHFRVFAMNDFGTSPISVDETIGSGKTLAVAPPDRVTGLDATDFHDEKIVLYWDEPVDNGGAEIVLYCIAVASSPDGDFADLADTTIGNQLAAHANATAAEVCRDADEATDYDGVMAAVNGLADGTGTDPVAIVVDAMDEDGNAVTMYENEGLDDPDIVALRYRLYVVTDDNGDEVMGGRRISRAASNTATGRTVSLPDAAPEREKTPAAPENLRAVAFSEDVGGTGVPQADSSELYFYWTTPSNYPKVTIENPLNWVIQVEMAVPTADGTDSMWLPLERGLSPVVPPGYAVPDFAVNTATAGMPNMLEGPPRAGHFQVRYLNQGPDNAVDLPAEDDELDDVPGEWAEVKVALPLGAGDYINLTANSPAEHKNSTLPIILKAVENSTDTDLSNNGDGLRYTRNPDKPKERIDLRWTQDANLNTVPTHQRPTGYVIDRSDDGGDTWKSVHRATQPTELGKSVSHTDFDSSTNDVMPGIRYTYRVFPVVITDDEYGEQDDFGLPAMIDASTEEAAVPDSVEGLEVVANEQTGFTLTWDEVTVDGGHPIEGYLVEIANDYDNDGELNDGATWYALGANNGIIDTEAADYDPTSVDADESTAGEFTFEVTSAMAAGVTDGRPLVAGSARWFRVIAITAENDGIDTTGGNQVDIADGELQDGSGEPLQSPGEISPTKEDKELADPVRGVTDASPAPPADAEPVPPEEPVDLTAEAAFDSTAPSDSDRGVFLTWNQVEDPTTPTTSYKIERIRMNSGVDALNNDADDWQFIGRARGDTSFTDRTPLRQEGEMRMYRVASEATGITDAVYVDEDKEVMYALHLPHKPDVPMDVMATAGYDSASDWWETLNCRQMVAAVDLDYDGDPDSETGMPDADSHNADMYCAHYPGSAAVMGGATALTTEATAVVDMKFAEKYPNMGKASIITVTWDAPSDGGSPITGYMVQSKYGDMNWMDVDPAHMGTGAMYIDKNLMSATAYYYQVKAMNAKGDSAWSMMAMQTTGNTDPMAEGAIEAVTLMAGDTSDAMDVSMYFSDADMSDTLTYTAISDMEMYATVAVDGSMVTITGVSAGMATVTVTANDGKGGTVMQTIMVTVPNSAPMAEGAIEAVTLMAGDTSDAMDVSMYFSDADMSDTLTYTAMSSDDMVATASVDESMVTITGVAAGSATVMVTATDPDGASVMQTIMVTVEAADTTLGNAMGLVGAIGSESNTIELTWTVGDNADIHWVFGIHTSNDIDSLIWTKADASDSHAVDMTGKPRGSYTFFVIAGQTDDAGDTKWSDWTPGTVTY